jgi:hypothetical protein
MLKEVNKDGNYIIQLFVDGKWQTLTEEYSASASVTVMTNACILTKLKGRVLSKRSNNLVLSEYNS